MKLQGRIDFLLRWFLISVIHSLMTWNADYQLTLDDWKWNFINRTGRFDGNQEENNELRLASTKDWSDCHRHNRKKQEVEKSFPIEDENVNYNFPIGQIQHENHAYLSARNQIHYGAERKAEETRELKKEKNTEHKILIERDTLRSVVSRGESEIAECWKWRRKTQIKKRKGFSHCQHDTIVIFKLQPLL